MSNVEIDASTRVFMSAFTKHEANMKHHEAAMMGGDPKEIEEAAKVCLDSLAAMLLAKQDLYQRMITQNILSNFNIGNVLKN